MNLSDEEKLERRKKFFEHNNLKKIYALTMPLNETVYVYDEVGCGRTRITKVPGGWLYGYENGWTKEQKSLPIFVKEI